MDRISELSDELLIKILSFLPTKTVVSTSVLSKRWEFLWMWLPNLKFGSKHTSDSEFKKLKRFLLRNLPLHRAPFIESLRLEIPTYRIKPKDIKLLVLFAVSHDVRELEVRPYSYSKFILPSSLYISRFLLTLKLNGCFIVDVPRMVSLPSLKTLRLHDVSYVNKDYLQRLLSNCPVLEDLWMYDLEWHDMGKFIVMIPSLQRLSLVTDEDLDEFVLDSPSLEYLNLTYFSYSDLYVSIKNMPKLREAIFWISFPLVKSLIGSISSVKRLTLCLSFYDRPEVLCDDGFVFNKLEHLKLCICQNFTPDVLVQLLKISPNLQSLELFVMDGGHDTDVMFDWNRPSMVPECMLWSLQTFKWSGYNGSEEERNIVIYVLQNARRLKTATISFEPDLDETLDMVKELALSSRASTKCQLVFR